MAKTVALVEYDLTSKEIRRIIVPEDDSQLKNHKLQSGCGWASVPTIHLQADPLTRLPIYGHSLSRCADAVQAVTGVRPPNVP